MAEEESVGNEGIQALEELEKAVTCAICHRRYVEPKALPCCHYYCKQCIHNLALKTGLDRPFSCPECSTETVLRGGGVDSLQPAFFIKHKQALLSKLEVAHGKARAKCEMCLDDKAEAFCRQCAQLICSDCTRSHLRMKKLFPGHVVSTLKELKEEGIEDIVVRESTLTQCQLHDEPMKVFCFDCNCLICRGSVEDHIGHKYEFIKLASPDIKKRLTEQLIPLQQLKKRVFEAMEKVRTMKFEVGAQGKSVTSHIERAYEDLHKVLEAQKQATILEAEGIVAKKFERLASQEEGQLKACAAIQCAIDFTEQCVEHSSDDEIMCTHADIQSRIDRAIGEQLKDDKELEPVEEADIGVIVNCAAGLKELCQSRIKLVHLPFVLGEGLNLAEVGKTAELRVFAKPSSKIECTLTSLATGTKAKCEIQYIDNSEYHVWYVPTQRGRHTLGVVVNGQDVAGSPFKVFVSLPPSELGKPVGILQTGSVNGITVTDTGQMNIVGDDGYMVISKDGDTLKHMTEEDLDMSGIRGVCIEEDSGCVYIAGLDASGQHRKIVKLGYDFKVLHQFTGDRKGWFWGVSVVGETVMAYDFETTSIIAFSKDLKYLKSIDSPDKNPLSCYFSQDKDGHLYIGDCTTKRILILSQSGRLIHSFSYCSKEGMRLSEPRGVSVFGHYVYVTSSLHKVSVFTITGEHVATFGQQGTREGEFNDPWEIIVDQDGYIYVCEHYNKRVQIF